jgi:multiple sugar transport system substrate-binding protein
MRLIRTTNSVAVMATVALLAAACGGGSSTSGNGVTQLTLLTHYSDEPMKPGLQKMVDEWNSSHPKIQVKTQVATFDDLLSTITVRQTGGKAADIIQPYGLWAGQLAASNVLTPAPADVTQDVKSNFSQAAVGAASVGGKVYGYPTEVQTYALFYNKKLFADAGIAQPPATWDELKADAAKLTKHDGSGNMQVEGMGLMSGWDTAVVHPWMALTQTAGGKFVTADGKAAFDSDAGKQALQLERDLITAKSSDPAIDVLAGMPSGKVAMTINAGWFIGTLKDKMKDAYQDIGVAPVPGPTPGAKGSVAYGYFMGVNTKSRHQKEAWEFLKWLNADKGANGATRMDTFQYSVGTIPGRPADAQALAASGADPNFKPFTDALGFAVAEPNPKNGQKIKTIIQKDIEQVWTGQKDISGALSDAASQANTELTGN